MITNVETVTPEYANVLLGNNDGNRKVRAKIVAFYASEMELGRWQLTHQGIAISENGRVLDGQHRLSAIVKSGVSVEMTVSRGCKDSSFEMMDVGLLRNVSDTVGVHRRTAGVINKIVAFAKNQNTAGSKISHFKIRDIYESNTALFDSITTFNARGMSAGVTVGCVAYLFDGGSIDKVASLNRFLKYGTADGVNNAIIYTSMKILTNENRFTATIDATAMVYKALMSQDSVKIVRLDKQNADRVREICTTIFEMGE
jgi:hypothetical protein